MEDNENLLKRLNEFTRRQHTLDEVYMFDLILCDNEIDRDCECFSLKALESLQKLFIGKTGIFDHNPKGSNQTARIFCTEIVSDNSKTNRLSQPYVYLKACAYMIRTASNSDLIKEIDGGIKKEVSISCSSDSQKCSICGSNRKNQTCSHIKGKSYANKLCYFILDSISDAYEWSFVAVPAQINAGVTKHFNSGGLPFNSADIKSFQDTITEQNMLINIMKNSIKEDVNRLLFSNAKIDPSSTIFPSLIEKMGIDELINAKKSLMTSAPSNAKVISQLAKPQNKPVSDNLSDFKL